MTDARLGGERADDPLWRALRRLPPGGGVVFRHYEWRAPRRARLLRRVALFARARGLLLVVAGGAGGLPAHLPARHSHRRPHPLTASAHNLPDARRARRNGARVVFLSPVFPTASHPGAPHLGPLRFGLIRVRVGGAVVALGGMTPARWRQVPGAFGFAAIGWWVGRG